MKIKAVIDRIENEVAILFLEGWDEAILLPKKFLPRGSKEGEILSVQIDLDKTASRRGREQTAQLIRRLSQREE